MPAATPGVGVVCVGLQCVGQPVAGRARQLLGWWATEWLLDRAAGQLGSTWEVLQGRWAPVQGPLAYLGAICFSLQGNVNISRAATFRTETCPAPAAVPRLLPPACRLLGVCEGRVVYVESIARVYRLSLSGVHGLGFEPCPSVSGGC